MIAVRLKRNLYCGYLRTCTEYWRNLILSLGYISHIWGLHFRIHETYPCLLAYFCLFGWEVAVWILVEIFMIDLFPCLHLPFCSVPSLISVVRGHLYCFEKSIRSVKFSFTLPEDHQALLCLKWVASGIRSGPRCSILLKCVDIESMCFIPEFAEYKLIMG